MTDIAAFVEDLIQLQIRHRILLEGYDVSFWTDEDAARASIGGGPSDYDFSITEGKIRNRWEAHKVSSSVSTE